MKDPELEIIKGMMIITTYCECGLELIWKIKNKNYSRECPKHGNIKSFYLKPKELRGYELKYVKVKWISVQYVDNQEK